MSEETVVKTNKRRPWLAVTLSFIMPGLGHIYCGRFARAVMFLFICTLPGLFIQVAVRSDPASMIMFLLTPMIALYYILWLVVLVDSYRMAKRATTDYVLKDYNRWYVYLLLVLANMGGSIEEALSLRENYIEAFYVPAWSMFPTIENGDRFIANKIVYKNKDPQRGDIVVFKNPEDRRVTYIKRVVAVAGDTVEMTDGELSVNGHKLKTTSVGPSGFTYEHGRLEGQVFFEQNGDARYKVFITSGDHPDLAMMDFGPVTVPPNHCFVLGDNRCNSKDSRHFGPVPLATIKGRAGFLYFPARNWSRFGKID